MPRRSFPLRPPRRTIPTLLTLFAILVLVAACGSSAQVPSQVGTSIGSGPASDVGQPAAQPGTGTDARGVVDEATAGSVRDDALIVRTGQLGLQVADVDAALADAQQAIAAMGGYIGASTRSMQDDEPVATVTYRVPVERWDEALTALRGLADEVLSEQTDAMEVTAQAVDLDARIKNLRATETALQAILLKAQKIPDILEVQAQLSDVRGQIEQLVAQRQDLGDRAALGTIRVAYGVEVVAVTQATQGWDPASEVDQASATLVDILQGVASAGIWFGIVWLPVLAVLGVLVLLVVFVIRRSGLLDRRGTLPIAPSAGAPD
jgi:hypothetical protein